MQVDAIQESAEIKFSFPSPTDGYDLTTQSLEVRSLNYKQVGAEKSNCVKMDKDESGVSGDIQWALASESY